MFIGLCSVLLLALREAALHWLDWSTLTGERRLWHMLQILTRYWVLQGLTALYGSAIISHLNSFISTGDGGPLCVTIDVGTAKASLIWYVYGVLPALHLNGALCVWGHRDFYIEAIGLRLGDGYFWWCLKSLLYTNVNFTSEYFRDPGSNTCAGWQGHGVRNLPFVCFWLSCR